MNKNSVKTLADLVLASAEEYGDKTYISEKNGKETADTSFSTFKENCLKVTAFLNSISGGRKLHAAVIGGTSSAYLECYFGTVMGGNVIVPLDAQLVCEDICDLINRADVTVFFFDARYAPMLPAVKAACPQITNYICFSENEAADISVPQIISGYSPAAPANISPADLAAIDYTSGTTGKAKGVMLSHGNLIDNAMCQDGESSPEDTLLTVLPVHHIYCFTCDILLSLRYGATLCVNDSMMRIAQNLKLFRPTIVLLVPMIIETLYKQIMAAASARPDTPPAMIAQAVFGGRLKGIYSGGAYLDPDLITSYKELGIPIAQGYGMTECSPRISTASFDDTNAGNSVGTIVNGCQVRIDNGEIVVKSPSVMQGYYKDKAATDEVLTKDGWLRTGDLGYVDETDHVHITGRKKNLIILSNGENVSPEEIENKFSGVESVLEVLVYSEEGVITAEVFPNKDVCGSMSREDTAKLIFNDVQKINKTLTSSKTIHRLRIRDIEFEKTTSRKIKRQQSVQGEQV